MSIEQHTFDGINYLLDTYSDLERDLLEHGVFEAHLQNAARKLLPDNGVVFDIGANVGLLTLPFAKMVVCGKVYAFEADLECYFALVRNINANASMRNQIKPLLAVVQGDREADVVTFYTRRICKNKGISSSVHLNQHVRGQVRSIAFTVDEVADTLPRVDFLKIDVEGGESKVLMGAAETIRKHKPAIIWEYSVILDEMGATTNTLDSFTLLDDAGYEQSIIQRDGTLEPLPKWRPNLNYADILAVHKSKVSHV